MAKVTMSSVWDRTAEVLGGRFGALLGVAFVTSFIPLAILLALNVGRPASGPAATALVFALLLLVGVVFVFGCLAMTALASDAATTRSAAWRSARARLLPALGVYLALGLVLLLGLIPIILVLASAHVDMAAFAATRMAPKLSPAILAAVSLYYIAYLVFLIWMTARLAVVIPVVLNERLGVGAIRRSLALTRGLTWRLIGVLLLYVIVLFIVRSAATMVVGVVLRLLLGPAQIATAVLVAGLVGVAVSMVFTILVVTFAAQLYVALAARQPAQR